MGEGNVLVYGAGMSGLVAACNLAESGYDVVVREKEKGFGGSPAFNPSIHTTPLDIEATSEYIGIDISPAFHPVSSLSMYLHDFRIEAPVYMSYHVERSSRPQSLDTLLYEKCKGVGVEFAFDEPLRQGDIESLRPPTIIACGLNPAAYEYLQIPYATFYAWMARGEREYPNYALMWLDECVNEYGYLSFCNDLYFNLLFSYAREVPEECLRRYRDFLMRTEGIEENDWEYVSGAVPVASPENPALIRGGLIMCGTMSGCIDPLMGFGISGALVSGKVAAMAVSDPQKAQKEFLRFTRNFEAVYHFKHDLWYKLRERVDLMEGIGRTIGPQRCVSLLLEGLRRGRKSSAIPGFSPLSCH